MSCFELRMGIIIFEGLEAVGVVEGVVVVSWGSLVRGLLVELIFMAVFYLGLSFGLVF